MLYFSFLFPPFTVSMRDSVIMTHKQWPMNHDSVMHDPARFACYLSILLITIYHCIESNRIGRLNVDFFRYIITRSIFPEGRF